MLALELFIMFNGDAVTSSYKNILIDTDINKKILYLTTENPFTEVYKPQ